MTKEDFIGKIKNWSNHRIFLWEALEATKHLGLPVLELGCGMGSTPFLRQYCADNSLELVTFDSNKDWAEKMGSIYLENWDTNIWFHTHYYGVVLIDEAPGEHRKDAIEMFIQFPNRGQVLIVHDSEPAADAGYQVRTPLSKFKYNIDYESQAAWTTAASNFIDVTKFTW